MKIQWSRQLTVAAVISLLAGAAAMGAEEGKPAQNSKAVPVESHICTVSCVDPHACCRESEKVLEILQLLCRAYAAGDLKTFEKYLDDNCTTFNETSKTLLTGKQAVLADLKQVYSEHAPGGEKPLLSFTIDQPYAKLSGDGSTCVVTFVATKETGGVKPIKERANITDIFIKRADGWKKLHWRGRWEQVSDTDVAP